jgi:hypothetical protein
MSDRFHIKPDGTVGKCTATKRPCPFGGEENHYSTPEAAYQAFQERMEKMEKEYEEASGQTRTPVKSPDQLQKGDEVEFQHDGVFRQGKVSGFEHDGRAVRVFDPSIAKEIGYIHYSNLTKITTASEPTPELKSSYKPTLISDEQIKSGWGPGSRKRVYEYDKENGITVSLQNGKQRRSKDYMGRTLPKNEQWQYKFSSGVHWKGEPEIEGYMSNDHGNVYLSLHDNTGTRNPYEAIPQDIQDKMEACLQDFRGNHKDYLAASRNS